MRTTLSFLMALSLVGLFGCSKPQNPAPKPETKTPATKKAPASKETKTPAKATTPKAEATTAKDAKKAPPQLSKEALEVAYVEIYCAKESGNAAEVFKLFKKYGFSEPKHWTDIWKKAVKDEAWVAKVHQRALNACKNAKKPTP